MTASCHPQSAGVPPPALGSLDLMRWPPFPSGRTLRPEPVLTSPLLSDVRGRLDDVPSPYRTGFDGQILGHVQGH